MKRLVRGLVSMALVVLCAASVFAQQDATVDWKLTLQDLERRLPMLSSDNGSGLESWRADAEELRSGLAAFASAHPEIQTQIPEALPEKPSIDQLKPQLDRLTAAVNRIIDQTPGSPFHLGNVTVTVSAPDSAPALVSDNIDQTTIDQHNFLNIAKAFDYLPGVEIEHIAARNEAGIRVRGFTTRGQVPFYLDGIPISVPYDGYVDFNRFPTSNIADLQVTKGYSSPLLGPNALGGTINLVTNEPVKKFEGEMLMGTGSGNTLLSALRLGSRWRHFFGQASLDWLQQDFIPLSGNFQVNQYTKLPDITMTDHLNNSATQDNRYTGRLGWTPRGDDEYVFSFITQKGEKGVPLYQGPNTAATFNRLWSWPFWDMNSYYFHSTTGIGETGSLQFRVFYNQFKNAINMASNDLYQTTTATSGSSVYNEHTDGAATQFTSRIVPRNVLSGSLFFKDDTHREYMIFPVRTPFPYIEPQLLDRDQQVSIGLQDVITITSKLHGMVGFSADHFNGLQGEFYNSTQTGFLPFVCISSPSNATVSGCTLHAWNYNPQASLSYQVTKSGNVYLTFADRGRFPMLKDIYSASLGAAIPNPDLKPEHARNWNLGYSHTFSARTLGQVELFRSDVRSAIESVAVADPGNPNALLVPPSGALCPTSNTGYCNQNVNIGKEVHEGAEVKVQTTVFSRLTVDMSYAYLNRAIQYDFSNNPTVSQAKTTISLFTILPPLPRNKVVGTATVRLPRQILGMVSARYEGGITLQDTTYATTSPFFQAFGESFATMDLGTMVPIYKRVIAQVGIKNIFDRNFYYVAGYPEIGRNWYLNLRYQF